MADSKVSALSAVTPVSTDLVYVVSNPGVTPVSKKATLANVIGLGPFKLARVEIAHADIRTLPTAGIFPVVEGIEGKILIPIDFFFLFLRTAGYTNIADFGQFFVFDWEGIASALITGISNSILAPDQDVLKAVHIPPFSGDTSIEGKSLGIRTINEPEGGVGTLTPSGVSVGAAAFDVDTTDASSNSGAGVGATFHVVTASLAYTVTVTSHGTEFLTDDVLVFPGSLFGGVDVVNDLTVTIDGVGFFDEPFTGGDPANKLIVEVVYH